MIVERPIRNNIRVETLTRTRSPFIIGEGMLGYSELAAAGTPQTWHDWTAYLSAVTILRGGRLDGVTVRNAPGMLTLTIQDVEIDRFSPQLYREQPIRVTHVTPSGEAPLFTGWVRDMEQHYGGFRPGTSIPRTFVTITAVDAVARHDETTRYGAIPPTIAGETLAQRVARLAVSASAPVEIPTGDYLDAFGNPIMLGPTVYEASLSNHLTIAANTAGAMWYVHADGTTRLQPRIFDPSSAVVFTADETPGALSAVGYTPASGTETGFNSIIARNKTATRDPETGEWHGAETDYDLIPGFISLIGKQYAVLETNGAQGSEQLTFGTAWVQPNMFGWGTLLGQIRWNAQQDLTRIPDLDLGASITAEAFTASADPWNQYLVIGLTHTITPKRWMTDLTVIGAQ